MSVGDYLRSQRVHFAPVLHRPASDASRRADSVRTSGHKVAKTVVVEAGGRFFGAVLPATHRIDFDRLAGLLGLGPVRLVSEDELEAIYQDCERGARPPFGKLYGLTTVVDNTLAGLSEIVVEANLRTEDLRLRYRDFETLEGPIRGRFAVPRTSRTER